MKEIENHNNSNNFDVNNEIDFHEVFDVLWQGKWLIISFTTLISIVGLFYSLFLPNIYESKAVLAPTDSSSSINRSLQSYTGLAGLAGIRLPSSADNSNSVGATLKLQSLSFFENHIMPNIFLPDLMAYQSWDPLANKINYDKNKYNTDTNTWVRNHSYPAKKMPSAQESYEVFKNKHFSLSEDKKTGFITIKIKHHSPYISKEWTEIIVDQVNIFYREKDKLESEKAVTYLNNQIALTNLSEVKEAITQLIQEETKKLALIEANKFYVFDYIDPPAVMEKKSEPNRASICIFIALLGGFFSIIYILIKHYFFKFRRID